MIMKLLILGGSGILSTDFTKLCLDNKDDVYIVNRGKKKEFIDDRANLIIADLRIESVEELRKKISFTKYDVVIDFLSFNTKQMIKTLEIIKDCFSQYIFISSATAYIKNNPNEIISEKNPVGNKDWDYAYQKSLCEKYLRQKDINYTIIRPYVTFGVSRIPFPIIPYNHHYTLLQRIKENKPVIMLDDGRAICTLTSTKDFAKVLYRLLLNKKGYKEDFNITSNNRQTWKEVYLNICKLLNKSSKICSVSMKEIHKYMPEYEDILKGDKGQNMMFDNSKVLSVIGDFKFEYTLNAALKESIDYYESHPEMQGIDYKWEGKCDYIAKKKGYSELKCVTGYNEKSNNPHLYSLMMNPISRFCYEKAKNIKNWTNGFKSTR